MTLSDPGSSSAAQIVWRGLVKPLVSMLVGAIWGFLKIEVRYRLYTPKYYEPFHKHPHKRTPYFRNSSYVAQARASQLGRSELRSILIVAFTVTSICGFVLETDRTLYEMNLGELVTVEAAFVVTQIRTTILRFITWNLQLRNPDLFPLVEVICTVASCPNSVAAVHGTRCYVKADATENVIGGNNCNTTDSHATCTHGKQPCLGAAYVKLSPGLYRTLAAS